MRLPLFLIAFIAMPSCVTIGRHEELEQRVVALEKFKNDTEQHLKRDVERLENLNQRIKEAAEALRKNGASLNAKIDNMAEEERRIQGSLEELDHLTGKMSAQLETVRKFLDERFGLTIETLPKDLPTEPDKLLAYAEERFKSGQYDLARAVYRHFIKQNAQDPKVPRAMLMVGETYRVQRQFDQALKAYRDTFSQFPKSAEAPLSLLYGGHALRDKGLCREAVEMYKYLVKTLPKSSEAEEAKPLTKTKCP